MTRAANRRTRFVLSAALLLVLVSPRSTDVANADGSATYAYDALGRVLSVTHDTGVTVSYTYDANGNRLSETVSVTCPGTSVRWGCFFWDQANWSN